jgi:hypothetical protein
MGIAKKTTLSSSRATQNNATVKALRMSSVWEVAKTIVKLSPEENLLESALHSRYQ